MENNLIIQKLNQLEKLIIGSNKSILTVEELVAYTGYSRSYIYKLVHKNILPYSKPAGALFFEKSEIDLYLLQNKSKSVSQLEQEAHNYVNSKK